MLTRHGIEVVLPEGEGCCGSLVHHMGREDEALAQARANIDAWTRDRGGLDAILITASGCGTTVKDYGFMLRGDPAYADKAARMSALPRTSPNISPACRCSRTARRRRSPSPIIRPARCSTGSRSTRQPKELLSKLGFVVKDVPEGHLCCGSAGTYNILQPDIARRLRERKVGNIERLRLM